MLAPKKKHAAALQLDLGGGDVDAPHVSQQPQLSVPQIQGKRSSALNVSGKAGRHVSKSSQLQN